MIGTLLRLLFRARRVEPSRQARSPVATDEHVALGPYSKLVYELALHGLARQEAAVDELRARAATVAAVGSITATLFLSVALAREGVPLGGAGWIALGLVLLMLRLVYGLIRPRGTWTFLPDAGEVLERWVKRVPTPSVEQVRYGLADEMREARDRNQTRIEAMYDRLELGMIATGASVAAWLVELLL